MIVLDYVSQPADFGTMKARGVGGAVVYIAPLAWGWTKNIKPDQLKAARDAGFPLAFNFEQNVGDYLGGVLRGAQHGTAIEQAANDLGLPKDQPVYLSIDTEVPRTSYPRALEYFAGAQAHTSRPLNFYGQNELGEYLVAAKRARLLWMSESGSFPGNAAPTAHTAIQQHFGRTVNGLGGSYDYNEVLAEDWGQMPRPNTPAPPAVEKVKPMYRPAFVCAAVLQDTPQSPARGGVQPDGAVFIWDATLGFWGGMNGDPNFAGREAAQLVYPNAAEKAAGKKYTIVATSGERYALPKS